MILTRPCSSGSKKLSIRTFIWGIIFFCTMIGSFRISGKSLEFSSFPVYFYCCENQTDLFRYRKIASSNTFRLEAHAGFFSLLMRGIFDSGSRIVTRRLRMFYIKSPYPRIPKMFFS